MARRRMLRVGVTPPPGAWSRLLLGVSAALLSVSCGPAPRVGPPEPASSVAASTFSSIEQNILVPRCASSACHSGNPPASAPLSLDPGAAYANILSQPTQQVPGLNQVEPGNPDESYLLLKMRGMAGGVGGVATRMPISDEPVSDADLAAVDAWIRNGAPND